MIWSSWPAALMNTVRPVAGDDFRRGRVTGTRKYVLQRTRSSYSAASFSFKTVKACWLAQGSQHSLVIQPCSSCPLMLSLPDPSTIHGWRLFHLCFFLFGLFLYCSIVAEYFIVFPQFFAFIFVNLIYYHVFYLPTKFKNAMYNDATLTPKQWSRDKFNNNNLSKA